MIYTVTLNPAVDKTVEIPGFALNAVNRIGMARLDAGGKGINVSRWVHALGGRSVALGIAGGESGAFIEQALHADGIETDFVHVEASTRTNLKIVDPVNRTNTDINEPGAPVEQQVLDAVFAKLSARAAAGDIVVLAGKTPPGTPEAMLPDWIRRLQGQGIRTFVDVDGEALADAIGSSPYLIKPNIHELEALIGKPLSNKEDVAHAALALQRQGIRQVVVSMGGEGAIFAFPEMVVYAEGLPVAVGSTVGAGDSMVAALAYAQAQNLAEAETVRLAIAASAASVMQPGTGTAPRAFVQQLSHSVRTQIMP